MESLVSSFEKSCFYNLPERLKKFDHIYIYGAGNIGKCVLNYLKDNELVDKLDSFIVQSTKNTNINKSYALVEGIKVQCIDQLKMKSNSVVLIAANSLIRKDMLLNCQKYQIKNTIDIDYFDWNRFVQMPESEYPEEIKRWYKMKTGKVLNLDHPKTFNEKIQWLKLYDRNPLKTKLADKYMVRDYIKEKIGTGYLVPLLGVWNNFEDIDFDKLPDQFVLKCNHGSGCNVIVHDKSKLDISNTRMKFELWLKKNFAFTNGFELQYKDIPPKIIAEKYLENENDELWDYKFFCFNGKVKFIQVDRQRYVNHVRRFYSVEWKPYSFLSKYPLDNHILEKPAKLEEMLDIVQKLAEGFLHVRVDLYSVKDNIYFGEMTFSHESGVPKWTPDFVDEEIGKYIKLSID